MSSLTDYIRWYADFSFYEKPFNEVDNLVLSTLAYYQFDVKRPAAVRRCCTNSSAKDSFLKAVMDSRRFGSLMVSEYSEVFSRDTGTQFAAMIFHLHDNVYYISFRGTDNSLVGWREDFVMSYQMTQGQKTAVEYLERVIEEGGEYFVGGHSKGGNLAIYGTCHLSEAKLRRVKHVFNNDGPGLCPEVSDISLIDRIKSRLTVILPQYCVFGKIFEHDVPDVRIVTSSNKGLMQHDIVSWGVKYGKLDTVSSLDSACHWIDDVTDRWLEDVSPAEREKLVNSIFDSVQSGGADTYTEALSGGIDGAEDLLKNMVESDSLKTVAKIPEKALFGDFMERLRKGKLAAFINANQLVEGIIFVVIGILMLIFRQWSFQIIITVLLGGLVLFQLIYTIKKLYESHWDFNGERVRFYIFFAMLAVLAIILVKQQAIFIVGSAIAGVWLLVTAYKSFLALKESPERDFAFWKNLVKVILYAGCGIFIMLAPIETLKWFILTLGAIMAIDGVCTIVYSFIQANEKYSQKYDNIKEKVRKTKGDKKS